MKQQYKNQKVVGLLQKALGQGADLSQLAVFETIAFNTLPVTKRGSIFDKAVATANTLQEMSKFVQEEGFIPLHTMHMQGNELPVGRVFHAETIQRYSEKTNSLVSDLHALFYISQSTQEGRDLVDKINAGVVNEVSVGVASKVMKCSGCEFDYNGPEADIMNFWDQTCPNGHTIGLDGIHLVLDGLDRFYELSLVSLGAADHARILNPENAIIAREGDKIGIAADASPLDITLRVLSATKGMEIKMNYLKKADVEALKARLSKIGEKALAANHTPAKEILAGVKDQMTQMEGKDLLDKMKEVVSKFDGTEEDTVAGGSADTLSGGGADTVIADTVEGGSADTVEGGDSDDTLEGGSAVLTVNVDTVIQLKAENLNLSKALKDREGENLEFKLDAAALKAKVTELENENKALKLDSDELKFVKEFLALSAQTLLVASGCKEPVLGKTASELIEQIKTSQASLSKLPAGGLGCVTPADIAAKNSVVSSGSVNAFKTVN